MNKFSVFLLFFALFISMPVMADYRDRTASKEVFPGDFARWQSLPFFQQSREHHEPFRPYVENLRHEQIPQWENENWYVEDWTSQRDPMVLMNGFYKANIIMDQTKGHSHLPVLVVGPNFYHLSGLDKRRVMQTVDTVYGITDQKEYGSFLIKDWHTNRYVGAFDQNGLRLY